MATLTAGPAERGLGSLIRARSQGFEGDLGLPDRSIELPRAADFEETGIALIDPWKLS